MRRRNNWSLWLLLVPFVATLPASFYNSVTPSVGGLPFFDWYLLVWVVLTAVITGLVYMLRRETPSGGGPR
jgi:uncharacterized membrane protein